MKTRIMHLTYDMGIGGTEQVIKNLIEGSDPDLFEMSIFCIEQPVGPFGEMMLEQGIDITSYQRRAGFDLKLVQAIRKHIKQSAIDILHCHQYTPWVYGALASIGTKKKVILTEHGRFFPDRSNKKRKLVNPMLVMVTDHITAISQATKNALTAYEFISEKKIEVIYNGIKPLAVSRLEAKQLRHELGIADTTVVLGTIARLDPIKNHKMMLNAFASVLGKHPDTMLVIVGDGEERENLEQLANQLKISSQVVLTGYINAPGQYLNCMDIFLLPSLSEGTSMTLLEAMSLSKPCVVTDAGGNPEIITNNKSGLVTENDNKEEFANAIISLVENSRLAGELGTKARARFDNLFSIATMCNGYKSIYLALEARK